PPQRQHHEHLPQTHRRLFTTSRKPSRPTSPASRHQRTNADPTTARQRIERYLLQEKESLLPGTALHPTAAPSATRLHKCRMLNSLLLQVSVIRHIMLYLPSTTGRCRGW